MYVNVKRVGNICRSYIGVSANLFTYVCITMFIFDLSQSVFPQSSTCLYIFNVKCLNPCYSSCVCLTEHHQEGDWSEVCL